MKQKAIEYMTKLDRPILTNNDRRRAGLPTLRKGKGKRYKTRCEAMETISAFIDYVNA